MEWYKLSESRFPMEKKIIPCATIVLPTFNEKENIESIVKELLNRGYYIIVSDDGSTDGTEKIVKRLASKNSRVIFFDHSKFEKRGIAESTFDAAMIAKTEKIVVMDADYQHPLDMVPKIVSALDNAKLVVACRIKNENWGVKRILISFCGNILARLILSLRGTASCRDPVSGFFGFRKTLLSKINRKRVVANGIKALLDILKQLPKETKIIEIPYIFINRKKGYSKFDIRHIFLFFCSLLS